MRALPPDDIVLDGLSLRLLAIRYQWEMPKFVELGKSRAT